MPITSEELQKTQDEVEAILKKPRDMQPRSFWDIKDPTPTICSTLMKAYAFTEDEEVRKVLILALVQGRHLFAALNKAIQEGK